MKALGQGLTQKNRLKHSLSIATSNNSRTQVTYPLDIPHWAMSWDTQVTHLWRMIKSIVKQLRKHPLLTKMIYPVVTTEDFISCFGCVAEKTSSSPSGRHVGHYLACIDLNDELSVLFAAVHAAMMSITLAEGFCPERSRQAIDIMLEKIQGCLESTS
jgi:hypothetical protein